MRQNSDVILKTVITVNHVMTCCEPLIFKLKLKTWKWVDKEKQILRRHIKNFIFNSLETKIFTLQDHRAVHLTK